MMRCGSLPLSGGPTHPPSEALDEGDLAVAGPRTGFLVQRIPRSGLSTSARSPATSVGPTHPPSGTLDETAARALEARTRSGFNASPSGALDERPRGLPRQPLRPWFNASPLGGSRREPPETYRPLRRARVQRIPPRGLSTSSAASEKRRGPYSGVQRIPPRGLSTRRSGSIPVQRIPPSGTLDEPRTPSWRHAASPVQRIPLGGSRRARPPPARSRSPETGGFNASPSGALDEAEETQNALSSVQRIPPRGLSTRRAAP